MKKRRSESEKETEREREKERVRVSSEHKSEFETRYYHEKNNEEFSAENGEASFCHFIFFSLEFELI